MRLCIRLIFMGDLIRYQQLENGIYEITFLAKTRASVDEFFQVMQIIYEENLSQQKIRLIVDLSMSGMIPMQYMFQQSQTWRRRNPRNLPLRGVILYPEKGILPIARVLVNTALQSRGTQANLRLESILNREEALEWLLRDTP
jgi:hypothetical protein